MIEPIHLFEFINMCLSLVGAILNVLKNKWGFAFWIVGNISWLVYGFITKQYYFMFQYFIFAITATWGFIAWMKDDKKKKDKKRK